MAVSWKTCPRRTALKTCRRSNWTIGIEWDHAATLSGSKSTATKRASPSGSCTTMAMPSPGPREATKITKILSMATQWQCITMYHSVIVYEHTQFFWIYVLICASGTCFCALRATGCDWDSRWRLSKRLPSDTADMSQNAYKGMQTESTLLASEAPMLAFGAHDLATISRYVIVIQQYSHASQTPHVL